VIDQLAEMRKRRQVVPVSPVETPAGLLRQVVADHLGEGAGVGTLEDGVLVLNRDQPFVAACIDARNNAAVTVIVMTLMAIPATEDRDRLSQWLGQVLAECR
jgi:hypothetical protein